MIHKQKRIQKPVKHLRSECLAKIVKPLMPGGNKKVTQT